MKVPEEVREELLEEGGEIYEFHLFAVIFEQLEILDTEFADDIVRINNERSSKYLGVSRPKRRP